MSQGGREGKEEEVREFERPKVNLIEVVLATSQWAANGVVAMDSLQGKSRIIHTSPPHPSRATLPL